MSIDIIIDLDIAVSLRKANWVIQEADDKYISVANTVHREYVTIGMIREVEDILNADLISIFSFCFILKWK